VGRPLVAVTKLARVIKESGRAAYKVAADAGLQPWQLSRYVNGHESIPPVHLTRLSVVLDVEPEDLIGVAE
jgi:hypothetical protein